MIRMLLQCEDAYFVNAFSNYASLNCPTIEFVCFTTVDRAREYLAGSSLRLDAVLGSQELLDQVNRPKTARFLVSDQTVYSDEEAIRINIYQSGTAIISDIKSALALSGGDLFRTGGRNVHVVAGYSVQGGSGKSVLSYALAAAAARAGKQALYISLDPFPALGQLYEHNFSSSIDDLLFALKGSRDLAPVVLDTLERNMDQVMVLPPFHFAGDLLSLTQEELERLIRVLVEKTDLEYIFIDLPTGLQPMNLWVLEQCTTVMQVYTDDMAGRERMLRVDQDVYFKNLPIHGQILTVLNQSRQKTPEEGIDMKIPRSESLQQGRRVADVQERNPAFLKSCTDLLQVLA